MKRPFSLALIATILAFAGGTALAESSTYTDMDADDNGLVSESEFQDYFHGNNYYDAWDSDGNGKLTEEEFANGLYDFYDDNDDGHVSSAEWEDGIMADDEGHYGFWDV